MGDAVMKMLMGFGATDPIVLGTIFLGVAVVIIGFILGRRSGTCENTSKILFHSLFIFNNWCIISTLLITGSDSAQP